MHIIFNMVTLLTFYCPKGFQLSVVDFQQCLEGCWDHRRLLEQSCLTLHQLELSQTWDKRHPSQASLSPTLSQHQAELKLKLIYQVWKFTHSSCSFSNYAGYLFAFSGLLGQSFVEHSWYSCMLIIRPIPLGDPANPNLPTREWRMGWEMDFSSEELKCFVSAATGWNIRWKQLIWC